MKRLISASLLIGCLFILSDTYAQRQVPRQEPPGQDSLIQQQWGEREKYIREGYEKELGAFEEKQKGDVENINRRIDDLNKAIDHQYSIIKIVISLIALIMSFVGVGVTFFSIYQSKRTKTELSAENQVRLAPVTKRVDTADHFSRALALDAQGKYQEAINEYQVSLNQKPDFYEALFNLGVDLSRIGDFAGGERSFRKVLDTRPSDAWAHNNLALTLRAQGKIDDAINEFQTALKHEPSYFDAYSNLADTLFIKGDRQSLELGRTILEDAEYHAKSDEQKNQVKRLNLDLADLLIKLGDRPSLEISRVILNKVIKTPPTREIFGRWGELERKLREAEASGGAVSPPDSGAEPSGPSAGPPGL